MMILKNHHAFYFLIRYTSQKTRKILLLPILSYLLHDLSSFIFHVFCIFTTKMFTASRKNKNQKTMKNNSLMYLSAKPLFAPQFFFLLVLTSSIFCCQNKKSNDATPPISFDQFLSDHPLDLVITTDLNSLFEKKENQKDEFQVAHCTIQNQGNEIHDGKIKVKKRGVTRKKICNLPPIMLKIGKGKSKLKLKMVTPCHQGEDFQQLVYKEYLSYQLYHQLTEFSFRTQLVNITYQDSNGNQPSIQMKGFVIENDKQIASRLKAEVMPSHKKLKYIDQNCYRMFTMFQYFIGNTDWNLNKRHNIRLICKKDSKTPIPVPYDFDYSGLVNAPYAIPHTRLPIKNVRERHFMWRGKNRKGFKNVIALFEKKKNGMIALLEAFPYLAKDDKDEMLEYLQSFYHQIQEPKYIVNTNQ